MLYSDSTCRLPTRIYALTCVLLVFIYLSWRTPAIQPEHVDVASQVQHYSTHVNDFGNKEDFSAWRKLFKNYHVSTDDTVIVAGVNEGLSIEKLLSVCLPARPHVYGFEIVQKSWEVATRRFATQWNVAILHAGISDHEGESSVTTNFDDPTYEGAGLFKTGKNDTRWRHLNTSSYTVPIQRLAHFYGEIQARKPILYLIIDCEGHEPNVISGMGLEKPAMRKAFPLFQYELGGTWVDSRHDTSMRGQYATALHLELLGYRVYLIGNHGFMRVSPKFFRDGAILDEGYGHFVQGNALVVHPKFVAPSLLRAVDANTIDLGRVE